MSLKFTISEILQAFTESKADFTGQRQMKILSEWGRWIPPYVQKQQDLKYKTENNTTLGIALMMESFNCRILKIRKEALTLLI